MAVSRRLGWLPGIPCRVYPAGRDGRKRRQENSEKAQIVMYIVKMVQNFPLFAMYIAHKERIMYIV